MQPHCSPNLSHVYSSSSLTSPKNHPTTPSLNQFPSFKSYGTSSPNPNPYFYGVSTKMSLQSQKQTHKAKELNQNDQRQSNLCRQAESHIYIDGKYEHMIQQQALVNVCNKKVSSTFDKYRLSNLIYLKSFKDQYPPQTQPIEFKFKEEVIPEQKRNKNSYDQSQKIKQDKKTYVNSKLNTKTTQESGSNLRENQFIQTEIYSRYIESLVEKYGYSPDFKDTNKGLKQTQLKDTFLKQTRENTSRFTQISKKTDDILFANTDYQTGLSKGLFKLDEELQQMSKKQTYLPQSIILGAKRTYLQEDQCKFSKFRVQERQYKEKEKHQIHSKPQQKHKGNQANFNPCPNRNQILIKQYRQQNYLLERDNQELCKSIESQIDKQRLLLHKLNTLMTKLEHFKSPPLSERQSQINQCEPINSNIKEQQVEQRNTENVSVKRKLFQKSFLTHNQMYDSHQQQIYDSHQEESISPKSTNQFLWMGTESRELLQFQSNHKAKNKLTSKERYLEKQSNQGKQNEMKSYRSLNPSPSLLKQVSPSSCSMKVVSPIKKKSSFDHILQNSLFKQHNRNNSDNFHPRFQSVIQQKQQKSLQSIQSLVSTNNLERSHYQNGESQVSCFESKFVPKMSDREKLNELERKFEEELKKYFGSQASGQNTAKRSKEISGQSHNNGSNKRVNKFNRESGKKTNGYANDMLGKEEKDLLRKEKDLLERQLSRQKLSILSKQIQQLRVIVGEQER